MSQEKQTLTMCDLRRFLLVLPPDGTFGALVNNTWNGMIGMAINKVSFLYNLLVV